MTDLYTRWTRLLACPFSSLDCVCSQNDVSSCSRAQSSARSTLGSDLRTYLAAIVFLTLQQREPMLKKRDNYEDILEERRNSSDLKYAFGCYSRVLYKGLTPCNANMLKNIVYSDQLRYVINQVGNSYHWPHVQRLSWLL